MLTAVCDEDLGHRLGRIGPEVGVGPYMNLIRIPIAAAIITPLANKA